MKTKTELNKIDSEASLSVNIGFEVSNLLNLRFKAGITQTSWGTKSVKGLGECIRRIVEEQTQKQNNNQ